MDKVQKPMNPECYISLSEPFPMYLHIYNLSSFNTCTVTLKTVADVHSHCPQTFGSISLLTIYLNYPDKNGVILWYLHFHTIIHTKKKIYSKKLKYL
jgi:hypothetical protein